MSCSDYPVTVVAQLPDDRRNRSPQWLTPFSAASAIPSNWTPPLTDSINWVCRELRRVITNPKHHHLPSIVHQSLRIAHFPQIGFPPPWKTLTVASALQVRSCSLFTRFSTLMCSGYSLTQPINLEPIRSPGTLWIVPGLRGHREQRGWELESCNWLRGNVC
jgi:hypothetical protein